MTPDCIYSHEDGEDEMCENYDKGFCIKGPHCKKKHLRKVACPSYISGECLRGAECPDFHPTVNYPKEQKEAYERYWQQRASSKFRSHRHKKPAFICYRCGLVGHKAAHCRT
ncbi:18743_t:CDS:2 [Acaulospora morrowiae]|uniref:mRNA 3'-end-processing protein n=1 Tax=Acaulospora morrowiae TaxID=94023 RepID=A0A9N8YNV8_9GLOM|nr:18743_t:CDS:2 [Acaulospora morrowiae]